MVCNVFNLFCILALVKCNMTALMILYDPILASLLPQCDPRCTGYSRAFLDVPWIMLLVIFSFFCFVF